MSFLSKIGSFVGDIGSTALDAVMGFGTDFLSNELIGRPNAERAQEFERSTAKEAFERELDVYENRYTKTAADLKRAGINPILAASSGFNVGTGVNAQMARGFQPPTPSGANSARAITSMKQQRSQSSLSLEQVGTERAKQRVMSVQEGKVFAETLKLEKEFEKMSKEILKIESQTELNQQQKQLIRKKGQELMAKLSELTNISSIYKTPAGKVLSWVKEVFNALNLGGVAHKKF